MLDEASTKYLQACKNSNQTFDSLKSDLAKNGWTLEKVQEAEQVYATLSPQDPNAPQQEDKIVFNENTPDPDQPKPKPKFSKKIPLIAAIVIGILLVLTASTYAAAYLVTTEKVSTDNHFILKTANQIMLSTPFMTPRPELVLQSAFLAHQESTQHQVDFSFAATSGDFMSVLQANTLDAQIKGYSDFSDPENIKFDLNASITNDFNVDLKKNNEQVYIKINKIPSFVLQFVGLNSEAIQPILENWIVYDTSPMDTEAQKHLETNKNDESPTNKAVSQVIDKLLTEDVLPSIEVTKEKLNEYSTFKLSYSPSGADLDRFAEILKDEMSQENVLGVQTSQYIQEDDEYKISNNIKDFSLTLWVDTNDHFVRKTLIRFIVKNQENSNDSSLTYIMPMKIKSDIEVAAVLILSDFGTSSPIETPSEAITPEEFMEKLSSTIDYDQADPYSAIGSFARARDTQRRSDLYAITNSIYQYAAEHDGYLPATNQAFPQTPTCIGTNPECFDLSLAGDPDPIVPTYIREIPVDPSVGTAGNTQYMIYEDQNGRVVASAIGELTSDITVTR